MWKTIRDAFFYSRGKLSAGKFWASVFSVLFVVAYIMRLVNVPYISDTFIGIVLGSLATVVGFYTWNKFSPPGGPP